MKKEKKIKIWSESVATTTTAGSSSSNNIVDSSSSTATTTTINKKTKKREKDPILTALHSSNENECLIALTDLSNTILVSSEEDFNSSSLLSSSVLIKSLLDICRRIGSDFSDLNVDLMLLACRCLLNLIEVNPVTKTNIISQDGLLLLTKVLEFWWRYYCLSSI